MGIYLRQWEDGGDIFKRITPFDKTLELDWIVAFIRDQRRASKNSPRDIANALYEKMLETFKPVETLIENGRWGDNGPGDRIVSYVIAGYPKNFKGLFFRCALKPAMTHFRGGGRLRRTLSQPLWRAAARVSRSSIAES